MEHTPGPWNQIGNIGNIGIETDPRPNMSFIADISKQDNEKEEIANAHLIAAAPDTIEALEAGKCPHWVHDAAITDDIEALRKIALWYSDWNNNVRLPALSKAKGEN